MRNLIFIQHLFLTLLLLIPNSITAQKRTLDHSDYDNWKSLTSVSISHDGKTIAALNSPQEGDTTLLLFDTDADRTLSLERITRYKLSTDGSYIVALQKEPFADRREARIKKKKGKDAPQNKLLIVNRKAWNYETIDSVNTFRTAADQFNHIAYTISKEDTTKKKSKPENLLILRNLNNGQEDTIRQSKDYLFSRYGNSLAVTTEPIKGDSIDLHRVHYYNLDNSTHKEISAGQAEYRSLSFDEAGQQLVYISTNDTAKLEQKAYDIRYFTATADSAIIIANQQTKGIPSGWIFNQYAAPTFSKNGTRIFVGTAPRVEPKDTTIVDFEMASLDIWHWEEDRVPPQQKIELRRDQSRIYKGIIDLQQAHTYKQIATEEMPNISVADEDNGRFALLTSNLPYLRRSSWDGTSKVDAWILDLESNHLQSIGTGIDGYPALSPKGDYTYWWDYKDQEWHAYDNKQQTKVNLTADIPVNFFNEKHDTPSNPRGYGIAGWSSDDKHIFIYDAYDIWKIDPQGKQQPINITQGKGRADAITFRYLNTDPEKRFIEPKEELLLTAFDNVTKKKGYYTLKQKGRNPLQRKVMDGYNFVRLQKAKEANTIIYQKSNFNTSPNLYLTTNQWKSEKKLTDINPQMEEINWGTAELISWTSYADRELEGIVYKPEDFDPNKKYPLMVYFYEQHADNLYNYFTPAPSRSTINIPFFVSRGYIVFTPDIHYTVGQPGEDAYNAVVSGTEALAKNSWIDKDNMAIQGQSWGGYQVSYLITRTDMYKAAGAGAPVSNMTSAYGGIRWESGRSRQYQYEKTQSRLGSTMSDSLQLYIDNSPVFFADKVNTPLLIMHNDNDGAVPWYQGIEYFMSLRRLNKPVWMLQYNNEAHNLRERRNTKDLSIRLQQFFDHYLKGAPMPVWMSKGIPVPEKGKTWGYELEE